LLFGRKYEHQAKYLVYEQGYGLGWRLRHWIIEAQHDGTAPTDVDPVAASVVVEAMLRGVGYQWMLNPQAFQPTAMVPTLLDAVLGLIGRPAGLCGPHLTDSATDSHPRADDRPTDRENTNHAP